MVFWNSKKKLTFWKGISEIGILTFQKKDFQNDANIILKIIFHNSDFFNILKRVFWNVKKNSLLQKNIPKMLSRFTSLMSLTPCMASFLHHSCGRWCWVAFFVYYQNIPSLISRAWESKISTLLTRMTITNKRYICILKMGQMVWILKSTPKLELGV